MAISNPVTTTFRSKVLTAVRTAAAASGNQAYTGVGFKPAAVIALTGYNGADSEFSIGVLDDAGDAEAIYSTGIEQKIHRDTSGLLADAANNTSNYQRATVVSIDPDGFTLAWVKGGSGHDANLVFLCLGQL